MKSVLLTTAGLLALACAYLGYRTYALSQEVAFLKPRAIPYDVREVMARKLLYADKTWHAGRARDWQGAGWYAWQVRRMAGEIAEAGLTNANGPLAELEQAIFLPTIEPLIDAMRANDASAFEARYRDMVAACNACHAATDHAYVRIAVPGEGVGPWNQTFEPSELGQPGRRIVPSQPGTRSVHSP